MLGDLLAQIGLRPAAQRGAATCVVARTRRRRGSGFVSSDRWNSRRPFASTRAVDLAFGGEVVVEFDEELHFNRYRLLTLDSSWYRDVGLVDAYRGFCTEHEGECVVAGDWGERWSNPSWERIFGAGGPPGSSTVRVRLAGSSARSTTRSRISHRSPRGCA